VCCRVLPCVAECCSVLQCVAVCYSVLQCVAVCCRVLPCVAVCCSVWHCVAVCCRVFLCVAVCCGVLQCVAVLCSVLQCVAVCCSVLQCVTVCCSVLQCVTVWCDKWSVLQCIALLQRVALLQCVALFQCVAVRHPRHRLVQSLSNFSESTLFLQSLFEKETSPMTFVFQRKRERKRERNRGGETARAREKAKKWEWDIEKEKERERQTETYCRQDQTTVHSYSIRTWKLASFPFNQNAITVANENVFVAFSNFPGHNYQRCGTTSESVFARFSWLVFGVVIQPNPWVSQGQVPRRWKICNPGVNFSTNLFMCVVGGRLVTVQNKFAF